MTDGSRWVIVLCAALVCSCGQGPRDAAPKQKPYPAPQVSAQGPVLAKAGPVAITTEELGKRLAQQGPVIMERMNDPARRKQFLQEQVRFELLAQEAWDRGLQDNPEVLNDLKKAMVQRLIREEMEKRTKDVAVSDGDLQAAYKASYDEFNKPETVRLSQIVRRVANDADRKKAHVLLEKLKKEIADGEAHNKPQAFAEAARNHSDDDGTKLGGGDLQFMTRAELETRYGPEVAKAAIAANVGEMVIADATDATVLFKKTGLRRAVERTLEMVKPQVRAKVQREHKNAAFEKLFDELEKKHGVTYDYDALFKMKLGRTATAAPEMMPHDEE